jgi:hypothetical protein
MSSAQNKSLLINVYILLIILKYILFWKIFRGYLVTRNALEKWLKYVMCGVILQTVFFIETFA